MNIQKNESDLASRICDSASASGFDQCGIVPLKALTGYDEALRIRSARFPESKALYTSLLRLSQHSDHPWAKSVVVCTYHYGKYIVPDELDGHIARYYLYDWHNRPDSDGYRAIMRFEADLKALGLTIARDEIFSIAPSRMAAEAAGLGRIRQNGFLYTDRGSWVWLETWLIDQHLETPVQPVAEAECPKNCRACIEACPTGALCEPYMTDIGSCVTRLTYSAKDLDDPSLRTAAGPWVYGCDACQRACPANRNKWEAGGSFMSAPLEPIRSLIGLEALAHADDHTIKTVLRPHFRFIAPDNGWVLRVNAVRAMGNSGNIKYTKTLRDLCHDKDPRIAEMAAWSLRQLEDPKDA